MSQKGLTILLSAQITAEKPLRLQNLAARGDESRSCLVDQSPFTQRRRRPSEPHLKPQLAVWNERLCETQLQTQLHAVRNTHTQKIHKRVRERVRGGVYTLL